MTAEETELLAEYERAKAGAVAWKEYEQAMRKKFVATFGDPRKNDGTERVQLDGKEAVMGKRLNYKVKNDDGQVKYLESIMPPEVFFDVFKVTYDLSITGYKKLSKAQQNVVDIALIITEGMPTLELIPSDKVI